MTGQFITDEQTLEKLFRAGYTRWVEDAKKRLGPDAASSAPRVVSKAFNLAWVDRKRFQSQDELDAFLGANIQHGSARELSRIAGLHRMAGQSKEHHETHEMTVEEAWDRLKGTLQGGAPEAQRKRASTARHEAAEHMAALGKEKFNWKPVAAIAAVGIVIGLAGYFYVESAGEDRNILHALAAGDVRAYETSFGQQANVTLDDSTIVRLGPESKLTVPKMFGIELRSVRIDGTANFEVRNQQERPFDVRAMDVAITAPMGAFTVRNFRDDSAVIVHTRKGALGVRQAKAVRDVAEGMSLRITPAGEMTVPSSEQLDEASAWVEGNVAIVGHNLRDALPLLKRWFGLEIRVPDATLLERNVFIRAPMGSRTAAIAAAEQSGGLKFTYIGENMAFQDTQPSRPGRRAAGAKGTTKR